MHTRRMRILAAAVVLVFTQVVLAQTEPTWTQFSPAGPPSGRLLHSAVYDAASNRMTVFGGQTSSVMNDVWVLMNANGLDASGGGGLPTWTLLQPDPTGGSPGARVAHTATYDPSSNRMTVFGGQTGGGVVVNDVWVLTNANGLDASGGGGLPTWTLLQPDPAGGSPNARFGHSAIYDPTSNRMIVFGGRAGGVHFNDLWVLTNANGSGGSPTWMQLSPTGGPPAGRSFPRAIYDPSSNRMTVFGGITDVGAVNDVWVLTNANGSGGAPTWTQLQPDPTGGFPSARFAHTAIYDPTSNRLVVFGGQAGSVLVNDVWVLTNANGLGGSPAWMQLSMTDGLPSARWGHSATYDPAGDRMTVFGGLTVVSFLNDVWVLQNANGGVETIAATIDIRPKSLPNSINMQSHGLIPVAILSSATFDAPTAVNVASLTFGRTGSEESLAFCNASGEDVNSDGLLDLVCHFHTGKTGFEVGDTQGILRGTITGGQIIEGIDSVRVIP